MHKNTVYGTLDHTMFDSTDTTSTYDYGFELHICAKEPPELIKHKQTDYYKWCKRKTGGDNG